MEYRVEYRVMTQVIANSLTFGILGVIFVLTAIYSPKYEIVYAEDGSCLYVEDYRTNPPQLQDCDWESGRR